MRPAILALVLLGAACSDAAAPPATGVPGRAVEVVQVLDGDSLRAAGDGTDTEVRLLGINAPERDECHADRSRAMLEALVAGGAPTLTEVDTDQFGRVLAYVGAGGQDVNLALVASGAALASGSGHARLAEYVAAEHAAVAAAVGLWQPDACGPATSGFRIAAVEANPAGPDEEALDGEWADIAYDGGDPVDLTGWTLRDDSSVHRFAFPDGYVVAPGSRVRVVVGCGAVDAATLFWCSDSPIWNNGGDAALLLDANGNVAARLRYQG